MLNQGSMSFLGTLAAEHAIGSEWMSDESALATLSLEVYDGTRLMATLPVWRTIELGRREPIEPPPFARLKRDDGDRIVIADLAETSVSRKHLRLELLPDGQFRIFNQSAKNSVVLAGGRRLAPGEQCLLRPPITCELGNKVVQLKVRAVEEPLLQSLRQPALVPGQTSTRVKPTRLRGLAESSLASDKAGLGEEDLLAWIQASM